jgi:ankyrin repeat protein
VNDDRVVSHLERLRKDAKRWLKAIRAGDRAAIDRLRRATPRASGTAGLRDVQHALARERGFDGWRSLTASVTANAAGRWSSRAEALGALLRAADQGDVDGVKAVLDLYPDLIDERGELDGHSGLRTALHFASSRPFPAVMRVLLERGADPNIRDEGDNAYPLHFIAEKGRLDLARLLVEHGADPIGAGDVHELDAIGWATAFEYVKPAPELVDYLLAHGARHTIASAVAVGDVDAIREIVARSPGDLERPMDRTNHRRRPLHLAVVKQQPEALTALLALGADTEAVDAAGLTPIDQAALGGQAAMVETLLAHGATLTLAAAVVLERYDDLTRLVVADPGGLLPGRRWGSLIARAAERSTGRVIDTLVRLGASPDAVDDTTTSIDGTGSYTALHAAAWHGNDDAVRALLGHGANPRIRDTKYCATAAGWANYAGRLATRDLILAGPIDIFDAIQFDARARLETILDTDPPALERPFGEYATCEPKGSWCTPLAVAVLQNKADAARVLIARGASVAIVSPDGRTLHDIAREPGHEEVAAVLGEGSA